MLSEKLDDYSGYSSFEDGDMSIASIDADETGSQKSAVMSDQDDPFDEIEAGQPRWRTTWTHELRHDLFRIRFDETAEPRPWSQVAELFNKKFGSNHSPNALCYQLSCVRAKYAEELKRKKMSQPFDQAWLDYAEYVSRDSSWKEHCKEHGRNNYQKNSRTKSDQLCSPQVKAEILRLRYRIYRNDRNHTRRVIEDIKNKFGIAFSPKQYRNQLTSMKRQISYYLDKKRRNPSYKPANWDFLKEYVQDLLISNDTVEIGEANDTVQIDETNDTVGIDELNGNRYVAQTNSQ